MMRVLTLGVKRFHTPSASAREGSIPSPATFYLNELHGKQQEFASSHNSADVQTKGGQSRNHEEGGSEDGRGEVRSLWW